MTRSHLTRSIVAVATTLSLTSAFAQTPPQSEADLQAIVAKKPTDLAPYVELARLYAGKGRRDDAEQVLRQALTVHRDSSAVYDALAAIVLHSSGPPDADKMISIAEEWLAVDPTLQKAQMLAVQGHVLKAAGLKDRAGEAVTHFDSALAILDNSLVGRPDDQQARAMRMMILRQKANAVTDPTERDRLLAELAAAQKDVVMTARNTIVWGSGASGGRAVPSAFPNAVRVGGNVSPPQKIKDVKPVMPPSAVEARVQGVVILEVVIDEAGKVADVRMLRSIPLLDQAAIDAVRQWEFAPTQINGTAVPVIMTVTVQFTLASGL